MSDKKPDDDLIGQTIAGRYRIISRLGAGGMGVAYRAWDEEEGRPVVIKIPKKAFLEDPKFAERFAREIRLLQGLKHPHIVPIVDVGEHEGLPYVAMRFLPGGSLSNRRLRDEKGKVRTNPPGMLHLWLPAVADALDHVHANGVVHRDVKPANIFFDAYWNAFLGDFGIAKIVEESESFDRENTLTATGAAFGTEPYMSPERFTPKAVIGGSADQYALAVMAYEMVAGKRPFDGETTHIAVEVMTQPVPRLDSQVRGLPASLVDAVHRGLSKIPGERFSTCREFAYHVLKDVPLLADEPDIARLLCPKCSNILKLPVAAKGQKGKCPKCQTTMKVADDLGALWLLDEARRQRRATASGVDVEVDEEPAETGTGIDEAALEAFKPVSSATPIEQERRRRSKRFPNEMVFGGMVATAIALAGLWMNSGGGGAGGGDKPPLTYEQKLAQAEKTLQRNPNDKDANEFLGRHWCFKKENWKKGLPYLAKSREIVLWNTAKKELDLQAAKPTGSPSDRFRLAEAWWNLVGQKGLIKPEETEAIKKHAAEIYVASVDGLTSAKDRRDANKWLDKDAEFRRLVDNKRPPEVKLATAVEILAQPPITNSIGMKLKLIPPGTFMMGSDDGNADEKPVHQVRITKPFYIGVYEVTNAQWKAVTGNVTSKWKDDDRPVEQISWEQAKDFCARLSMLPAEQALGLTYRLPTEAEWEYCCRAGTSTRFSHGDDARLLTEYAWFGEGATGRTRPVGQKKPNSWMLFDMHGNVWEWCHDRFSQYPKKDHSIAVPETDAKPILRGGSWFDEPVYCRSSLRNTHGLASSIGNVGLRIVGVRAAMPPAEPAATPELTAAYAKLKEDPSDRAANGVIGRHLCFAEEKWTDGLPFLAKCEVADFSQAATAELLAAGKSLEDETPSAIPAPQANPGSSVQAAKRWWALAARKELKTASSAAAIRAHAAELYTAHVSALKSPLDVQFANEWLDTDKEFRELVGNKRPGERPRTTFAFNKAELEQQFAFHGNAAVNDKSEIECRGGQWSKAVTRAKFKIPLKVEFDAYAFPDRTFDMDPGILADENGGGGIELHYGTNHNTQTHLYVFGKRTVGLPHARIEPGRTYRIAFDIDEFRNLTIAIDGKVVHASTLPEGARSEGHISCCGGVGHIAYKGLSVQWDGGAPAKETAATAVINPAAEVLARPPITNSIGVKLKLIHRVHRLWRGRLVPVLASLAAAAEPAGTSFLQGSDDLYLGAFASPAMSGGRSTVRGLALMTRNNCG